jgi:hypothetical protein
VRLATVEGPDDPVAHDYRLFDPHRDQHRARPDGEPNDGSACNYQDHARAVDTPTTAVRQAVQTECLYVIALSVNARICGWEHVRFPN